MLFRSSPREPALIYLLDTNVCVRYLNGRSPAIKRRLEGTDPGSIALCSVVKGRIGKALITENQGFHAEFVGELHRRILGATG